MAASVVELARDLIRLDTTNPPGDEHPELFAGVKHAIGEGGGEAQHLGGRTFYPVMVCEKRGCQMVARLRGPGGHGSIPMRGGAMARLAEMITRLDSSSLPVHITT